MPESDPIIINETAAQPIVLTPASPVYVTGGSNYTLPPANATALGGVQIGSGIAFNANGLISVTYAGLADKPDLSVYLTTAAANSTYLPIANFTYNNLPGKPTFSNVAFSGSYNDLFGTPNLTVYLTIATANATYQPLGNYLTAANLTFNNLTGKPTTLSGYGITDAYPLSGNPSGFLVASNLTVYAPLANPAFTGVPTAPNAANGTASNQVSTTQFVANTVSGYAPKATAVTLNGIETLTNKTLSNATMTGTQYFNGTAADKVQLKSPRETFTSPTISSGTLTLDLVSGTLFKVSLNAAISTIVIANTPSSVLFAFILEFTADGTSRAVTWPASFVWLSGSPPIVPSANGAILALVLYTTDGGTTWLAGRAGSA